MPKRKKATSAKHRIEIIDRELYHLQEVRQRYCKRLLKMGMTSWIVGVLVFATAAFFLVGLENLSRAPNLWLPLMILAPAAPLSMSAMFIRRLYRKEEHLKQLRKSLLGKFEKEVLKKVEKLHKR